LRCLTCEELAGAHRQDFTIANAPERLARTGDGWKDALQKKHSLEAALAKTTGWPIANCGKH
jgi:bifunctional non-homologous end joining protein LigD